MSRAVQQEVGDADRENVYGWVVRLTCLSMESNVTLSGDDIFSTRSTFHDQSSGASGGEGDKGHEGVKVPPMNIIPNLGPVLI